ncbi:unnamed protein product [Ectocarpus sp. 13 AM-2016]
MKSYTLLLAALITIALVCPSCAKGFGRKRTMARQGDQEPMAATVSTRDKDLAKMRAYKAAAEEMGEDADELAMLKRVEEITEKLLRESFPDAYKPAPAKRPMAVESDDVWENGTVVRYLARIMALLLAAAGLYAWNDKDVRQKPDRTIKDTPPRSSRTSSRSSSASDSRKMR